MYVCVHACVCVCVRGEGGAFPLTRASKILDSPGLPACRSRSMAMRTLVLPYTGSGCQARLGLLSTAKQGRRANTGALVPASTPPLAPTHPQLASYPPHTRTSSRCTGASQPARHARTTSRCTQHTQTGSPPHELAPTTCIHTRTSSRCTHHTQSASPPPLTPPHARTSSRCTQQNG